MPQNNVAPAFNSDLAASLRAEMDRCAKCGQCRSVCPVFLETGDEAAVARGRISLAEALLEGRIGPSDRLQESFTKCLDCLRCDADCPSGVAHELILQAVRQGIAREVGAPRLARFALRHLLPRPRLFERALRLAAGVQRLLPASRRPPLRHLPLFLAHGARIPPLAPKTARRQFREMPARKDRAKPSQGRAAIFTGCLINAVYPEVAADLAARLSMSFAFAPEYGFPRREGITSFLGNAILSAEPLTEVRAVPITSLYDWTRRHPGDVKDVRAIGARTALIATINLGRTPVTLGVAHLERLTNPAGRAIQIADLIAAIPTDGSAVIGGDFNTTTIDLSRPRELARLAFRLLREPRWLQRPEAHEPLFGRLIRAGFTFEGANVPLVPTFTPATPMPRFSRPKLDWIAVRGLRPLPGSARVVCATRSWGRRISDHDFIACDLEL